MKRNYPFYGLAMLGLLLMPGAVFAQSIEQTIVYIKCTYDGMPDVDPEPWGSGVLVSESGHILTAKHVVYGASKTEPPGLECFGSIGKSSESQKRLLPKKASSEHDAIILKHPDDQTPFMKYCALSPQFARQEIFATGFPLKAKPAFVPSSRLGILSTTETRDGIIETDGQTTEGMSGGAVSLARSNTLIGIVVGANTNDLGLVTDYAVLAAEDISDDLGRYMTEEPDCLTPRFTEVMGVGWTAGVSGTLNLGMHPDEGFCYITKVWGRFDDLFDNVEIRVDPEKGFQLVGEQGGNGKHGAYAQCVRF